MSLQIRHKTLNGKVVTTEAKAASSPIQHSKSGWVLINQSDGGTIDLPLAHFLEIASYALENTDLIGPDDPRLAFIRKVSRLGRVKGYNPGGERLSAKPKT